LLRPDARCRFPVAARVLAGSCSISLSVGPDKTTVRGDVDGAVDQVLGLDAQGGESARSSVA
jgi:hypothetical protein